MTLERILHEADGKVDSSFDGHIDLVAVEAPLLASLYSRGDGDGDGVRGLCEVHHNLDQPLLSYWWDCTAFAWGCRVELFITAFS